MIIRHSEMSNTIPDQKVTATFLVRVFLCFVDLAEFPLLTDLGYYDKNNFFFLTPYSALITDMAT